MKELLKDVVNYFNDKTKNCDYSDYSKKEISEYVDEILGEAVRAQELEWNDVCDEVNELRADLEDELSKKFGKNRYFKTDYMTNQSQLNKESLAKLSKVAKLISNVEKFEANQMEQAVLRAMMNSRIAFDSMTSQEQEEFENNLIESFKEKNWIK